MMQRDPIKAAQEMLTHNSETLFSVFPKTMQRIIREELWRDRMDKEGRPFTSFQTFVEHHLWQGLGIKYSRLIEYCRDDKEALAAVMGAIGVAKEHGNGPGRGYKKDNNIMSFTQQGTSQAYTLSRLKRDRPDLAAIVVAGEMTANAAAIQAGFRKKMIQIEPTQEGFQRAIEKYLPGWALVNKNTGEC